jgi:hypothetical protein
MRKPLLVLTLASLLSACAPAELTEADARTAMQARMERAGERAVKVLEMHSFELTDCAPAEGQEGVACQVRMDVSFTVNEAPQRDDATQRMRFVRESGRWVAYPDQ